MRPSLFDPESYPGKLHMGSVNILNLGADFPRPLTVTRAIRNQLGHDLGTEGMTPSDIPLLKRHHWMCRLWFLGIVAFLCLTLPRGLALDAAKTISQFNCRNWTRQNGLPVDKISSVTPELLT